MMEKNKEVYELLRSLKNGLISLDNAYDLIHNHLL